jgi:hypothetical protein
MLLLVIYTVGFCTINTLVQIYSKSIYYTETSLEMALTNLIPNWLMAIMGKSLVHPVEESSLQSVVHVYTAMTIILFASDLSGLPVCFHVRFSDLISVIRYHAFLPLLNRECQKANKSKYEQ